METLSKLLVSVTIIAIFALWVYYIKRRLLKMWQNVTHYEILFYRQMDKVLSLFNQNIDLFSKNQNEHCIKTINRYQRKKVRLLHLAIRQELFNVLSLLYDDLVKNEDSNVINIVKEFTKLQKIRRKYNSLTLIYNQTINVFPTRYIALKMKLEMKEYFG